jgi:hypothetical protein
VSYLYGDATPSPLTVNFIDLLREVLDYAVKVMAADRRIRELRQQGMEFERATAYEMERLDQLRRGVIEAVEMAEGGVQGTPTARAALALKQTTMQLVQNETARAQQVKAQDMARLAEQTSAERARLPEALQSLLLRHDLPGSVPTLHLRFDGQGYVVRLTGRTPWGLHSVLDLQVPPGNLFQQVVRLDRCPSRDTSLSMEERLFDRFDVEAPALGGFFSKSVKLQIHKLIRHHLQELLVGVSQTRFKLRLNPDGTGPGFEIVITADDERVQLVPLGADGQPFLDPHVASPEDAARLLDLCDRLIGPAFELARSRRALLEATFDDTPLPQLENITEVVDRLVAVMGPVVIEIGRHTLSPTELVLKRQLSGDRREEVFVTRAELLEKIAHLDENERRHFDGLGLEPPGAKQTHVAVMPERRPPPVPAPAAQGTVSESVLELEKVVRRGTGFHRISHLPPGGETTPAPEQANSIPSMSGEFEEVTVERTGTGITSGRS